MVSHSQNLILACILFLSCSGTIPITRTHMAFDLPGIRARLVIFITRDISWRSPLILALFRCAPCCFINLTYSGFSWHTPTCNTINLIARCSFILNQTTIVRNAMNIDSCTEYNVPTSRPLILAASYRTLRLSMFVNRSTSVLKRTFWA
ncbi:hypothetical protein F5Y18DRAFT_52109 [Xylariaceae sp. FL1019]|nr:hypothetical protein F5Y18DRAFT_52109 [Xylariaceae sp. FL1019]